MPRAADISRTTAVLVATLLVAGCGLLGSDDPSESGESLDFEPNRPETTGDDGEVGTYDGSNPYVLEAQEKYPTAVDFHRKVIRRTCSPDGGVCHNRKEYPDMHTTANFLSMVDAPCNVQPGELSSVYDRCERPGDRFKFRDGDFNEIEIGYVERVKGEYVDYQETDETPDEESPGLHIYLQSSVPLEDDNTYATGQFIRTFVDEEGTVRDLAFANFRTRWWILGEGKHLYAEVEQYQKDRAKELMSVGIRQGDLNRNGTYGARESEPVPLIDPGSPETSYLVARLRGSMEGEDVPGTRMPLANEPLSIDEMLALFCLIETLPEDLEGTPEEERRIDYGSCSYTEDPEQLNLLGEGVTWSGRVQQVLEANCGGCHAGDSPEAGFDVLADDAYAQVLAASTQKPDVNRVEPGKPEESYLWWKINAHRNDEYASKIDGKPMPINPIDGDTTLSEGALSDIKTWIENGANEQ